MEQFMNTRTPIKNIQQLPMLLLKTREKVDSLVEAYVGLPAFSQTPAAQIPDLKKALKRFAFVTITSATIPRKVAEKTILAERDTNPNIVQLSKKVIDNIKVNCSDEETAKESRRTLQPGWYGEVQTSSSPGRIRTVVESAEIEEEYPSETVAAVSSNVPHTEVIFHKEAVELSAVVLPAVEEAPVTRRPAIKRLYVFSAKRAISSETAPIKRRRSPEDIAERAPAVDIELCTTPRCRRTDGPST